MRIRQILGGAALAVGAIGSAVVPLFNPYNSIDDQVKVARTAAGQLAGWSLLWLFVSLALIAGIATVVGHVRQRGATLALIGGGLAMVGTVAGAAVAAFEAVPLSLASAISDDAELARVLGSFDTNTVLAVVFALWQAGTLLGTPLLVGGAARGGLLSAWLVVPVVLAMLGQAFLSGGNVVLTAGLGGCFAIPVVLIALRLFRPTGLSADSTLATAPEPVRVG